MWKFCIEWKKHCIYYITMQLSFAVLSNLWKKWGVVSVIVFSQVSILDLEKVILEHFMIEYNFLTNLLGVQV